MERYAIFVDAGYFSAAGAKLIAGSPKRSTITFDFEKLRNEIELLGSRLVDPRVGLLRIYWYDGATNAQPTSWHNALSDLPDVKVRLGHLRGNPPQQKGVDTRIVMDLIRLAERSAVSEAVLISGDEDLREGVAYIQECGVRAHLVTFEMSRHSATLIQEADTWTSLNAGFFKPFTTVKPPPPGRP